MATRTSRVAGSSLVPSSWRVSCTFDAENAPDAYMVEQFGSNMGLRMPGTIAPITDSLGYQVHGASFCNFLFASEYAIAPAVESATPTEPKVVTGSCKITIADMITTTRFMELRTLCEIGCISDKTQNDDT
ncbi:unnamed protein product [Prorocentrum cordatum]|uniref:Uncharacterized protein n=1 Tax=Prorocentrum cordatum TaxID=2364126 RepID=A0ABN9RM94_9DINO|nr:unnamed protein product [Polarella glacialis]